MRKGVRETRTPILPQRRKASSSRLGPGSWRKFAFLTGGIGQAAGSAPVDRATGYVAALAFRSLDHILSHPLLKCFLRELDLTAQPEMGNSPSLVAITECGGGLAQELCSLLDVEDYHVSRPFKLLFTATRIHHSQSFTIRYNE
jgi:hypothetical protein